ncbi:MAG TPA: glycosyltransferase family 39 protein, partial [Myxococcaceae bacterium]|nr:glycosyltransferase family 39 protein [Myxococcaceae bacterium]
MHAENPACGDTSDAGTRLEPRTAVIVAVLIAATLLPRLALFPVNENLHGDAVARTELARKWAADPHWIRSFADGAYQFGPLHLYTVGAALWVWPDREDAGRAVSLLFGVLSVIPLYFLTRRLLGWKAGLTAGLAFAAWGIHVQLSTTASSDSLALFLVLCVLHYYAKAREDGRLAHLFKAAVFLNLACATRYEAWLLVPLLSALLLFGDRDRVAALTRALIFPLLCIPFPAFWMQGNEMDMGSAFYPLTFIAEFHRGWVADGVSTWGEALFRLQNLFFWPGSALFTLTPLVGAFGLVGMAVAWRRFPEHRWLLWVTLLPAAYFTYRSALKLDFVPLARFTVGQVALVLPFVALGFATVAAKLSAPVRNGLVGVTALIAVAMPAWLGMFTWQAEHGAAAALTPVSPVSVNPPSLMEVARFLEKRAAEERGLVVLDADSKFRDLQIAFFSHVPEERLARLRWSDFDRKLAAQTPEYLVRVEGGDLEKRPDFEARGGYVVLGETWFEELGGFSPPLHVYRRARTEERP